MSKESFADILGASEGKRRGEYLSCIKKEGWLGEMYSWEQKEEFVQMHKTLLHIFHSQS